MFESETLTSPYGMKWMVESVGGFLFNTDARVTFNFVCNGCNTVKGVSKADIFADRSKFGKMIWLLISSSGTLG